MRRAVSFLVCLGLMMGACSSDPTTSEEYAALERELAVANQDLAASEANLSAIEQELANPPAAPPELASLVDDWFAALEQGDDSVLDLYVAEGYHLYGDTRFEYDEIVGHLLSDRSIEHEWITEPMLVAEDADGRYVVVRGMRNTSSLWSSASALLFEIVTTSDGDLRLVQTAWFYDSEW